MREDKQQADQAAAALPETQKRQGTEESKMGTMPVGRLLVSVSVPIVISMLVQALYNVVDSIFVARLGEDALAAVGLVFPVQNLIIAVAVGTGVGVNSLLSRRLGEKNTDSADRAAVNGLFLAFVSWLAFALLGLFGSELYMSAFTGGSKDIFDMGVDYMVVVTVGSLGVFMGIMLERLLQATGRSVYSMVSQLAGAITNIILDPIMIFGLLGFPKMGVKGAALATVIGQFVGMFVAIWANSAKNKEIQVKLRGYRPNPKTIKHIYQVGLPSIVMQSIGSVMTFGVNKILVGFGTTPVSIFSIYFKLQSFVVMPVLGFNNGMVPVIAYNYGARKRKRIEEAIRICLLVNVAIMVAGTLLFWFAPAWMLSLFDAQPHQMKIGVAAIRILSLGFPLAAVSIVFSGVFQALGKGMYSLIMSLVRQLLFLLPLAWLLARFMGLHAMWYSFLLAEIACILCAIVFFRKVYSDIILPIEVGEM